MVQAGRGPWRSGHGRPERDQARHAAVHARRAPVRSSTKPHARFSSAFEQAAQIRRPLASNDQPSASSAVSKGQQHHVGILPGNHQGVGAPAAAGADDIHGPTHAQHLSSSTVGSASASLRGSPGQEMGRSPDSSRSSGRRRHGGWPTKTRDATGSPAGRTSPRTAAWPTLRLPGPGARPSRKVRRPGPGRLCRSPHAWRHGAAGRGRDRSWFTTLPRPATARPRPADAVWPRCAPWPRPPRRCRGGGRRPWTGRSPGP
jgi:hypothetical protein